MKVLKFGGSSVGSPEIIKEVIKIVESDSENAVIVVSAFKGVTDQILELSNIASDGSESYKEGLEDLRKRHLESIDVLVPANRMEGVKNFTNRMVDELQDLIYGVSLVRDLAPKTLDHLLSFGERLSSYIISNAFPLAQCIDMRKFIKTDSNHGNAQVNFDQTNKNITECFKDFKGIAVAPGFIATNEKGQITTLGRGGSDYTAAIIAAALDA